MTIKIIRVPEYYAIVIADFQLELEEIISAIEFKKRTGKNPDEIKVLLYTTDEKEIAFEEYGVLSGNPKFIHELSVFPDNESSNHKH